MAAPILHLVHTDGLVRDQHKPPPYRPSHPIGITRNLHLPQMQATLEFLERHLHAPAPSIQAQNGTRLYLLERGTKSLT